MINQYLSTYSLKKERDGSERMEGSDLHCSTNCFSCFTFIASIANLLLLLLKFVSKVWICSNRNSRTMISMDLDFDIEQEIVRVEVLDFLLVASADGFYFLDKRNALANPPGFHFFSSSSFSNFILYICIIFSSKKLKKFIF